MTAGAAGLGAVAGSSAGGASAGLAGSGGAGVAGGGIGGSTGVSGSAGVGGSAGASGSSSAGGAFGIGGSQNGMGASKGVQTARPIGMPYAKRGYWEYLPKGYGDGNKRPLLVFEPGVGENGDGTAGALNVIKDRHGPPWLIANGKWPADRPFVVLSPQHKGSVEQDTAAPTPSEIHDFIAFAIGHYDVDPARVYLTGLSSGGTGAWIYLAAYPGQQVAAAALMSADSRYAWDYNLTPNSPLASCILVNKVWVWDFHGEKDTAVTWANDSKGIQAFQSCPMPTKPLISTLYPNTDHGGTWDKTYDLSAGNDIYAWLLGKSL